MDGSQGNRPAAALSVVVTITRGASHLGRCLKALENQAGAPPIEVIVPYCPALDKIKSVMERFPWAWFRALEFAAGPSDRIDPGRAHLLYDRRRTAGLRSATAPVIAITEDHAIPDPGWCAGILAAHQNLAHAVIGGAIENGSSRPLNTALYYLDFGRYQNPLHQGAAVYVSDINVSYKRRALEATRPVWSEFYHETAVHETLLSMHEKLWLTPHLIVTHDRGKLEFSKTLLERFAWARLFAGRRTEFLSKGRRYGLALLCPLLPPLLIWRSFRNIRRRRGTLKPFFRSFPLMCILTFFWSWGEFLGYVTGQPAGAAGGLLAPSL